MKRMNLTYLHSIRRSICMVLLIIGFSISVNAQENPQFIYNPKPSEAKVYFINGITINGLLFKVTADSVYIKLAGHKFWRDPQFPSEVRGFSAEQIDKIHLKRNYNLAKSYLTGFSTGIIGGSIVGTLQKYSSGFTPMLGGFIGSAAGLLASTAVGNTFEILANPENLRGHYPYINQRAILMRNSVTPD
ncbi:hypothetical protein CLV31_101281 [Algoriphagus aquaeductus]|uniref:Glycine zipper family protein n=1 Tax=Algoriphagus aquaeductus TaxID=475299 RepID=A0A326S364_9BACT|nr:hypothetical protein [Algoriphagus aquaeductus]PZV87408.1 hypothetical protein CLV31_101281 [Algoriphagus aquaeductus]